MIRTTDVLVIGAGAAGLMCAATAAARGLAVVVVDHARKAGKKILVSGGGRCNFTNMDVGPEHYLCANPHFVKSALARYSQWDFIALVSRYNIAYHEREHGRLFCDGSAKQIVNLLLNENQAAGSHVELNTEIKSVEQNEQGFLVTTGLDRIQCRHLVVATGGLSFPKLGATGFGYRIAKMFGHRVLPTRPGLVPLTLASDTEMALDKLSGISLPVRMGAEDGRRFTEDCLFTHRGLSGPAVLQTSNYWQHQQPVEVDLLPQAQIEAELQALRQSQPGLSLRRGLTRHLPRRLIDTLLASRVNLDGPIGQLTREQTDAVIQTLHHWRPVPNGSEGFDKAEVTLGGVDTSEISSKTMMSQKVKNLYFVGEVMDVTGWLGGYNFQWAWSSGYCCGQAMD
ncbi:NAD(P)/FAD-dependent oxidoreductase [Motiliproteus sp. SC1-56]|uniref:NAD(P)/FAD-dependent oxidoreductase n=1 Tax=Motiliproteus sp. SC1-56 TaxID=2799565 RepID=UPI001A9076FC|nr:NAD(P)/FAD-dependent oxidoreductase [Motiliproteus sp. SC1-56]